MEPSSDTEKTYCLLYVEDEPETRGLVAEALAEEYPRLQLLIAANGAEGLALFRQYRPQIIVTDIRMPETDGLVMAATIREIDSDAELIGLTAFSDTSFLQSAIELGFSHYVFKPVNFETLFAAINKSLAVTQLKQHLVEQKKQLQESEHRLQATFAQVAVGIGHLSLDGTFLRLNQRYCEIAGCSMDSSAITLYDFTHSEDVPMCMEMHQLMLDGKVKSYALEKRFVHPDGSIIWASLTISMVHDEQGEPAFLVAVADDITERKLLEAEIKTLNESLAARAEELEQANRDLKAFNHTVAHDLRQPLNLVAGYCQSLQLLCPGVLDEQCLDYVKKAYEGSMRMSRLISVLLLFAEAANAELNKEMVDLSALGEEVAMELRQGEPERRVNFRIAGEMAVKGDRHLLKVVLANLMGNAWKFTAQVEEGMIEFGKNESCGGPVFFVRDNGAGFDSSEAAQMFVPFQRLSGAGKVPGFGIGLGTVERIIKRHGGKVWADGEVGKGACFYFTLP